MTEADRALVERVEHDDLAGGVAQALCRIIRELEAEIDKWYKTWSDAFDRWSRAGRTIRRLRRRWQWEKRRADHWREQADCSDYYVEGLHMDLNKAQAERDAARAEVERWSRHAAKRESERDQYVTTALLANQQRDAARAEAAEARAAGWHEALDAVVAGYTDDEWLVEGGVCDTLRSRYPRKEAKG